MASISLPRVLTQRKTSLEIERENFEKFQAQSISKAISAVETPVKEKHVRSTIIGTFQEKGAVTFWICVSRLHLQENRIEAWKFCHLLHKVMREGHYNCLEHCQRHVTMIEDLGKLWVHLKECYGKLIHTYCRLLITKIEFHRRNHRFPGNLMLTGEELEAIGENDINNYFQMSVEIFDYMDDVLALQAAIFDSINNTSSMTSAGQCRLAPILPCVQDSNQLYDFSVKLLFKLHAMLPSDTLAGHRDRFLKQFRILKKFYQKTDKMQYFKNLITIPRLPENPPNFLIQSELRTYIPPVVILPAEDSIEEQDLVGNLIDTSDTSSQLTSPDTPSDHVDFTSHQGHSVDPIMERDSLIEHLQMELGRNRNEIHSLLTGHRITVETLNEKLSTLQNELSDTKSNLEQEKQHKLMLLEQQKNIQASAEDKQKLQAAEDRLKSVEEKFQKLKTAYTQMREEHITLIRQKADVDKQFVSIKRSTQELEAKIENLQTINEKLNDERSKVNESLQTSENETKIELGAVRQELDSVLIKHQQEKNELLNNIAKLEEELARVALDKEAQEKQKEEFESLRQDYRLLNEGLKEVKEMLEVKLFDANNNLLEIRLKNNEVIQSTEDNVKSIRLEYESLVESLHKNNQSLNQSLANITEELTRKDLEINEILKHKESNSESTNSEMIELIGNLRQDKENLEKQLTELDKNLLDVQAQKDGAFRQHEETIINLRDNIENKRLMLEEERVQWAQQLNDVKDQLSRDIADKHNLITELESTNSGLHHEITTLLEKQQQDNNNFVKSIDELNEQIKSMETDLQSNNLQKENLFSKLTRFSNEKSELECDLQDLLQQIDTAEESVSMVTDKLKVAEEALSKEKVNVIIAQWNMMRVSVETSDDIIKAVIHELDNPALSSLQCGVQYFTSLLPITKETLDMLEQSLLKYQEDKLPSSEAAKYIVLTTHLVGSNVIQGVATSNTSKDIVFGEHMGTECKALANAMQKCIQYVKSMESSAVNVPHPNGGGELCGIEEHMATLRRLLNNVGNLAEKVGGVDDSNSGDSVEGELANMDKAIEEAAARIEEMLQKSRAADSGLKLEVNEKILDACTSLMKAVRELVKKAKSLQAEIVLQGRGTNTAKEFYKRNHQWTEGLISAAKSVGMGAKLLLTAADKVVSHDGKLEHVMVASQEIAASTAQLVVASRVRATRGSEKLSALTTASRQVSTATGAVIATAKTCSEMVEDSEDMDMSGRSWQASKRMEMESRVKVLELEQALATERLKLAAFRRMQYSADNEAAET